MRNGVIYAAESAVVIAAAVSAALLYRPSGAEKSGRASKIEKFAYQSQVEAVSNYVSMATNSIQRVDLVGMTNYVDGATNAIPKTDLTPATNYVDSCFARAVLEESYGTFTQEPTTVFTNSISIDSHRLYLSSNVWLSDSEGYENENLGFVAYWPTKGGVLLTDDSVKSTGQTLYQSMKSGLVLTDGFAIYRPTETNITIDVSALTIPQGAVITFEVYAPSNTYVWPSNVTWLNDKTITSTNALFALRSFNAGTNWIANKEAEW